MFDNSSTTAASQTSREVTALGEDARYWRINALEAMWNGVDIAPRPSFWDTSVPLRERAPAVRAKLARTAGLRLAHMVAGERSFPTVTVGASGYKVALTDSEREALQALTDEIITTAKLSPRLRALLIEGLKTGSAVCVQSLAHGRPRVQILPAKWCTASRDSAGTIVRLVVQYKTPGADGKLYVYRREIGDGRDVAYEAIPAERLASPEFAWSQVDIAHTRPIEFVAVVWTRNLCEAVEESHAIDGHALAEGLEDELAAIDLELSQLLRNALYNGEPQMVRTGVDPEKPAVPMGAQGREAAPGFSWTNSILPAWMRGGGKPATQKAPGKVWDLAVGSDAKLLESTGAGAVIIGGAVDRLTRIATDNMGVVMVDPATLGGGDLSARALAMLHGPQLDTADNLRVEYGGALVEIVSQFLRLCAGAAAADAGVRLSSWDKARGALAKCWAIGADKAPEWNPPAITLAWGEYFEPGWSDISAAVDATTKAVDGRVMSRKAAVGMLAPLVGTVDAAAELEAIDADEGASREAVRSTLDALDGPRAVPADDAPEIVETAPAEVAVPAEDVPAVVDPATVKDAAAALNGAQVSSLLEIVTAVAQGQLPRASGVAMLLAAFPLTADQAESVMGEVGRSFVISPPEAPAAPPVTDAG
jgi:hypothetical protein